MRACDHYCIQPRTHSCIRSVGGGVVITSRTTKMIRREYCVLFKYVMGIFLACEIWFCFSISLT